MKKLVIGALLGALLLTLGIPGIAYANPGGGLDVDIAVVGDDADVDVSVYGDNANISVNGDGLATMDDLQAHTSKSGSQGDLNTWQAARRADNWIREIGQYLPDAVAILIIESGEHDNQLIVNTILLEEHELSISSNTHNIQSLWRTVGALDSRTLDTDRQVGILEQWQIEMKEKWIWGITVLGITLLLVTIVVVKLELSRNRSVLDSREERR